MFSSWNLRNFRYDAIFPFTPILESLLCRRRLPVFLFTINFLSHRREMMWCRNVRCWWSSTTVLLRSPTQWASYLHITPAPSLSLSTRFRISVKRTDYHLNSNHNVKRPYMKVLTMLINCVISSTRHDLPGKYDNLLQDWEIQISHGCKWRIVVNSFIFLTKIVTQLIYIVKLHF